MTFVKKNSEKNMLPVNAAKVYKLDGWTSWFNFLNNTTGAVEQLT